MADDLPNLQVCLSHDVTGVILITFAPEIKTLKIVFLAHSIKLFFQLVLLAFHTCVLC